MKTSFSFEKQLQEIEAPAADPAARERARETAVAEFRRVRPVTPLRPSARRPGRWMQMLAAASVAAVGVAIVWRLPPEQRVVAPVPSRMVEVQAPVADTPAEPAAAEDPSEVAGPVPVTADTAVQPAPDASRPVASADAPAPRAAERSEAVARADNEASASIPRSDPPTVPVRPADLASAAGLQIAAEGEMREVQVTGARIVGPANGTEAERAQFFIGETIANLRGLDPAFGTRTLTMIDGRRPVSQSSQSDGLAGNLPQSAAYVNPSDLRVHPIRPPSRDRFEEFESNTVKRTAEEPVSTFSLDVDTSSYSFVRRQILNGRLPSADEVRVEEMVNYFDYDWPAARSRSEPFGATVTVSDSPWAEGRKLVHIGIKG